MAYSKSDEMLTGDLELSGDREKFIKAATSEIDSVLGRVYLLPLSGLAAHSTLWLNRISVLISTGRYILAQSIGGEDQSLNAYGERCLNEGQSMLMEILTGGVILSGATPVSTGGTTGNGPSIIQGDATSGVDAFYEWMGTSVLDAPVAGSYWRPGL